MSALPSYAMSAIAKAAEWRCYAIVYPNLQYSFAIHLESKHQLPKDGHAVDMVKMHLRASK